MWDENVPGANDFVGQGDDEIREMKIDVRVWTEAEHYPFLDANAGKHKPGIIDTPELAPDAVTADKIASGVDVSGKGFKAESAVTAATANNALLLSGLDWSSVTHTGFGAWEDLGVFDSDVFNGLISDFPALAYDSLYMIHNFSSYSNYETVTIHTPIGTIRMASLRPVFNVVTFPVKANETCRLHIQGTNPGTSYSLWRIGLIQL